MTDATKPAGDRIERAGWLADKLHNGGDYGKEAAALLVTQAAEIDRLTAALADRERATMRLTLADLGVLADTAERNGTTHAFPAVALQWAAGAQAEIERLRRVWEDTRTQRDELLGHLTRGDPLPAWAVEWIRVYKA